MEILIVDDEPDFLFLTKKFIEDQNKDFNVHTVESAKKALQLLEEHKFDIIISDYQMPKIDGLSFLQTLREEKNLDIPFIIFTGKGAEEVAIQALNLKANRYIQKGGDIKTQYGLLVDAIIREVDHYQAEKKIEESEKRLRESEEVLRIVLENLSHGVFLHDLQGNFVLVNKVAAERTQYTKKELLKMKVGEIDAGDMSESERERMWEKLKHGKVINFRSYHKRKDGTVYPTEVYLNAIRIKKKPLILAITHDITQRVQQEQILKENEKRCSDLADLLPSMVLETDNNLRIVYANKMFFEKMGYSKEDLLKGLTISDLMVEEENLKIKENLLKGTNEDNKKALEYTCRTIEGKAFPVLVHLTDIKQNEQIIGKRGIIIDISELKGVEKQKEFLNAFINHDIKNKSIIIQGYIDLVVEKINSLCNIMDGYMQEGEYDQGEERKKKLLKTTSKDIQGYLEQIYSVNTLNLELTNKLNTIGKVEHEILTTIDLKKVVIEIEQMYKEILEEKGIKLILDLPKTKCTVRAGEFLKEVLSNLVENAIKHANCTKIKIKIVEKNQEGVVTCIIEDNGIGIPVEKRERVFETILNKRGREGGYGLFLVREIVQTYGGKIILKESKSLGGARVEIILKIKKE